MISIKNISKKYLRSKGSHSIDDYITLTSQFMSQNPLVNVYFEGEVSEDVRDISNAMQKGKSENYNKSY